MKSVPSAVNSLLLLRITAIRFSDEKLLKLLFSRITVFRQELSNFLSLKIFLIKNRPKWPQNKFYAAVPAVPAMAGLQKRAWVYKCEDAT